MPFDALLSKLCYPPLTEGGSNRFELPLGVREQFLRSWSVMFTKRMEFFN